MRKEKFYRIVIIALLLLNFGVLGYLWMGNHREGRPPHHEEPAGFIIESLQLDEAQQAQFNELRHAHHRASVRLREESRDLHDALFSQLTNKEIDAPTVDSLEILIAKNDSAKETLNFNHFRELKNILKPGQITLYNKFIEDIARRFGPPPRH